MSAQTLDGLKAGLPPIEDAPKDEGVLRLIGTRLETGTAIIEMTAEPPCAPPLLSTPSGVN